MVFNYYSFLHMSRRYRLKFDRFTHITPGNQAILNNYTESVFLMYPLFDNNIISRHFCN